MDNWLADEMLVYEQLREAARQGSAIAIAGGRGTSAATRGDESVACRRAHIPGRAPRTTSGTASLMDGPGL